MSGVTNGVHLLPPSELALVVFSSGCSLSVWKYANLGLDPSRLAAQPPDRSSSTRRGHLHTNGGGGAKIQSGKA